MGSLPPDLAFQTAPLWKVGTIRHPGPTLSTSHLRTPGSRHALSTVLCLTECLLASPSPPTHTGQDCLEDNSARQVATAPGSIWGSVEPGTSADVTSADSGRTAEVCFCSAETSEDTGIGHVLSLCKHKQVPHSQPWAPALAPSLVPLHSQSISGCSRDTVAKGSNAGGCRLEGLIQ